MNFIPPQQAQPRREFALCVRAGFGVETMKIKINEKAFSCRITQKNKFPNGNVWHMSYHICKAQYNEMINVNKW